jgi:hypothetical protein
VRLGLHYTPDDDHVEEKADDLSVEKPISRKRAGRSFDTAVN